MTTRPGGMVPRGALKVALIAVAAILGIIALYTVVGGLQRALEKLPGPLQLLILVASLALVWAQRRYFAPDHLERNLGRVGADTARPRAGERRGASTLDRLRARREARDSRFVEAIRREAAQIGAGTEAAVAKALASLDATLATHGAALASNETMIQRALDEAHASVAEAVADLAGAADRVANMCVGVIGHVQDNREQTRELERVIAQWSSRRPAAHDRVISLVEEEARERAEQAEVVVLEPVEEELPAKILCFHNDEWIGGVEIIDLTGENGSTRYWLRREADGYIFPCSFAADEIWFPEEPSWRPVGRSQVDVMGR